jgi:hypothetical protein
MGIGTVAHNTPHKHVRILMGFEVLTAVVMSVIFWDIALCSPREPMFQFHPRLISDSADGNDMLLQKCWFTYKQHYIPEYGNIHVRILPCSAGKVSEGSNDIPFQ